MTTPDHIYGMQDASLEIGSPPIKITEQQLLSAFECPKCVPSEKLIRAMGALLVCPNCDLILLEPAD